MEIMAGQKTVSQIEFEILDDFARCQNNFYARFLDDCAFGKAYRGRECFKRFQEAYPELEREITIATVRAVRSVPEQPLPYEKL